MLAKLLFGLEMSGHWWAFPRIYNALQISGGSACSFVGKWREVACWSHLGVVGPRRTVRFENCIFQAASAMTVLVWTLPFFFFFWRARNWVQAVTLLTGTCNQLGLQAGRFVTFVLFNVFRKIVFFFFYAAFQAVLRVVAFQIFALYFFFVQWWAG